MLLFVEILRFSRSPLNLALYLALFCRRHFRFSHKSKSQHEQQKHSLQFATIRDTVHFLFSPLLLLILWFSSFSLPASPTYLFISQYTPSRWRFHCESACLRVYESPYVKGPMYWRISFPSLKRHPASLLLSLTVCVSSPLGITQLRWATN